MPETKAIEAAWGQDVFHWPEFRALAERLGIPLETLTTEITIHIPFDGLATVWHTYRGGDTKE